MSGSETTPKEALTRLGASAADAIEEVLTAWAPGAKRGEVAVLKDGESPFAKLVPGTIASSVSYVDGVSGANIFLLTPAGARKLAEAMGVPPAEDAEQSGVSELELSAVAEVANQTMAAAAAAIGSVLGNAIEISPPDTRVIENPNAAADIFGKTPHAISTTFLIGGESCRLIQLVPNAFVARMLKAMDQGSAVDTGAGGDASQATSALLAAIGHTKLRVWAELGRTRMPLGRALTLPLGAVIDLDEAVDEPVRLFVNGIAFARGHLVVQSGEWALRVDELLSGGALAAAVTGGAPSQASEPKAESIDANQLEGALS